MRVQIGGVEFIPADDEKGPGLRLKYKVRRDWSLSLRPLVDDFVCKFDVSTFQSVLRSAVMTRCKNGTSIVYTSIHARTAP